MAKKLVDDVLSKCQLSDDKLDAVTGGWGPGTALPNCCFCGTPLIDTGMQKYIEGVGDMKIAQCPNRNCPQAKINEDGSITYYTFYYD